MPKQKRTADCFPPDITGGRLKRSASFFLCARLRCGSNLLLGGLRSLCSLRPLPPFPASPTNAELVSCGPFPYSFDGTRYQKQASTVRNMRAVLKKASWGTRRVFRGIRCAKQAFLVQKGNSVPETPSYGTELRMTSKSIKTF